MIYYSKNRYKVTTILKAILFCALPMLAYYESLSGIFSEITTPLILLMIVESLFDSFSKRQTIKIPIFVLILIFYIIIVTTISYLMLSSDNAALNSLILIIAALLLLVLNIQWLKENSNILIRCYITFVWIVVIAFIIQYFSFFVLKKTIVFKVPLLKLIRSYGDLQTFGARVYTYARGYSQFSSFFSEKAHFATYILPAILIYGYGYNSLYKNYALAGAISVAVLLSASGAGILGLIVIWMLLLMTSTITKKKKIVIIGLICVGIGLHFLLSGISDSYANSIGRLFSGDGIVNDKTTVRVFRGLSVFLELPVIYMIFGIGYRQYGAYSSSNNYTNIMDSGLLNTDYFSAFSQLLIYFGVIGFVIVIFILAKITMKRTLSRKILLLYLTLSIGLSIFLDASCILFFSLIIATNPKKQLIECY